jgi:hypothetical protein
MVEIGCEPDVTETLIQRGCEDVDITSHMPPGAERLVGIHVYDLEKGMQFPVEERRGSRKKRIDFSYPCCPRRGSAFFMCLLFPLP